MAYCIGQFKVFQTVIMFDGVLVMDILVGFKISTKMLFHHKAVF